jgi:hypothetical protein
MSFDAFMIELAVMAFGGFPDDDDFWRPYWRRGLEPDQALIEAAHEDDISKPKIRIREIA